MKFSIRDLFLVTVIAAFAVGWWVSHRAASRLAAANDRLEQEAKRLRDQLGQLTVTDEKKLHTIAIASDLAHAEKRWRWRLHFPSDRPFRICCEFSGLPESGVPAGDQVLYDTKGEFTLNASAVKDQNGVWKLVLDCDNGPNITMPIPDPSWLEGDSSVTISQAGQRATESVDPGKPLVLLRLRRSKKVEVDGKEIGHTRRNESHRRYFALGRRNETCSTHSNCTQAVTHEVQPAEPDVSDTPKRGWLSFSIRELMLVTMIVALLLTLAYTKWPANEGRYQMTSGDSKVFFLDTATGKIWVFDYPDWREFNSPVYGNEIHP